MGPAGAFAAGWGPTYHAGAQLELHPAGRGGVIFRLHLAPGKKRKRAFPRRRGAGEDFWGHREGRKYEANAVGIGGMSHGGAEELTGMGIAMKGGNGMKQEDGPSAADGNT